MPRSPETARRLMQQAPEISKRILFRNARASLTVQTDVISSAPNSLLASPACSEATSCMVMSPAQSLICVNAPCIVIPPSGGRVDEPIEAERMSFENCEATAAEHSMVDCMTAAANTAKVAKASITADTTTGEQRLRKSLGTLNQTLCSAVETMDRLTVELKAETAHLKTEENPRAAEVANAANNVVWTPSRPFKKDMEQETPIKGIGARAAQWAGNSANKEVKSVPTPRPFPSRVAELIAAEQKAEMNRESSNCAAKAATTVHTAPRIALRHLYQTPVRSVSESVTLAPKDQEERSTAEKTVENEGLAEDNAAKVTFELSCTEEKKQEEEEKLAADFAAKVTAELRCLEQAQKKTSRVEDLLAAEQDSRNGIRQFKQVVKVAEEERIAAQKAALEKLSARARARQAELDAIANAGCMNCTAVEESINDENAAHSNEPPAADSTCDENVTSLTSFMLEVDRKKAEESVSRRASEQQAPAGAKLCDFKLTTEKGATQSEKAVGA